MNKYLRAISTNFIYFGISTVFFLGITRAAIHVMGDEFFGLWSIMIAMLFVSNVGALGVDAIMMKFSSEVVEEDEETYRNTIMTSGYLLVFIMAVIMMLALYFGRAVIVANINASENYKAQFHIALSWIIAGILPQYLSLVPHGFLAGQLKNRITRGLGLFSTISMWGGAVLIALVKQDLTIIAMWCFLTNCMVFALYFVSVKMKSWRFKWHFSLPIFRKMFNFSVWTFLQTLAITFFQHFDRVIVGFVLGPISAGVYSVGTSLALRLSIVTGQITEVMIPYASTKDSVGENKKLFSTFRELSYFISFLLAAMSGMLILWMKEILTLWISSAYALQYSNLFSIFIIAYGFVGVSRPAHQLLIGKGKVKLGAIVYGVVTSLTLLSILVLSGKLGLLGAALSNLMVIILLYYNYSVYRENQKPIHWREVFYDLGWMFILPTATYFLVFFNPQLHVISKMLISLGMIGVLGAVLLQNQELKARLLTQYHGFIKK